MMKKLASFLREGFLKAVMTYFLLLAFISALVLSSSACGSPQQEVEKYSKAMEGIIDTTEEKLGEYENYWLLSLDEQKGIKNSLGRFRKSLLEGQKKVNELDFPPSCEQLTNLMRTYLVRGRSLADLSDPYSDYMDEVAAVAKEFSGAVEALSKIGEAEYGYTSALGILERFEKASSMYGTVVPPAPLSFAHRKLGEFMGAATADLRSAIGSGADYEREEESGDWETENQQEGKSKKSSDPDGKSSIDSFAEKLPQRWVAFKAELNVMY
ncbi:MAG: hypothetical protein PHO53_05890, partial [Actinomycetota bacterium]|nr:hypothetical protein [Actinomycetota bacterium]